jgi:hypothetical protein
MLIKFSLESEESPNVHNECYGQSIERESSDADASIESQSEAYQPRSVGMQKTPFQKNVIESLNAAGGAKKILIAEDMAFN